MGLGEGSGATGSVYNVFATPIASETAFEWPKMPKRCRVPRDSILNALQEEELVADTQPELVSTNPADDLEVRASKRRKTADHYRSHLCFATDRDRAREKSSLTVMRGCCQLSRRTQKSFLVAPKSFLVDTKKVFLVDTKKFFSCGLQKFFSCGFQKVFSCGDSMRRSFAR